MRFRAKSLTSLLFAFLLALPMISVISKVIYVQSNKNAHESYYGETINETIYKPITTIENYQNYVVSMGEIGLSTITTELHFTCDNITILNIGNSTQNALDGLTTCDNGFFYYRSNLEQTWLGVRQGNGTYTYIPPAFNTEFIINNGVYTGSNFQSWSSYFRLETHNNYSYLDNVFDYAVDEVIKENNFGNIDFFSYFTSIFVSDNQVNNRYIGYVNYYLNYALMVSLAYLLFLMLMWFVNFARRFLDRGMNYDW